MLFCKLLRNKIYFITDKIVLFYLALIFVNKLSITQKGRQPKNMVTVNRLIEKKKNSLNYNSTTTRKKKVRV